MHEFATLPELFPSKSRATLWRWRAQGKVRKPDLVINGVGYYRTDVPLLPDGAPERPKAVPPHERKAKAAAKDTAKVEA